MKIKPIFAWFDVWVGLFWDRQKRKLYVFPIPMFGFVISFPRRDICTCAGEGTCAWCKRICPSCGGDGFDSRRDPCASCRGTGWRR